MENLQLPNEWEYDNKSIPKDTYPWDFIVTHKKSSRYIIHMKTGQWKVLQNVWAGPGELFDNVKAAITYCLLVQSTERPPK